MQVLALVLAVALGAAGAVAASEEGEWEEELGDGFGGEQERWKPTTPDNWICYSTAGSEWQT